jgi:hypothetical protein
MRPDFLEWHLRDNGRAEVRHQVHGRWTSGLFDNLAALRSAAVTLGHTGNVYISINAPRPIECGNDMTGRALKDADITHRTRLAFDFDPVRPAGQPSTNAELAAALSVRNRFIRANASLGWPMPAIACSGNGAHAVYRWRTPCTPEWNEALAAMYRGLQPEFSTDEVHFDTTVKNPARIWRFYGTTNRKGEPTPDRPHRMAWATIPDRWGAVAPQQVMRLAESYAKRQPAHQTPAAAPRVAPARAAGRGDFATLDVRGWFGAHSAYRRYLGGGKHAVLCPWVHEHSSEPGPMDSSTVVWEAQGGAWPSFHCSHAHCAGRTVRHVLALWGDADRWCGRQWARGSA